MIALILLVLLLSNSILTLMVLAIPNKVISLINKVLSNVVIKYLSHIYYITYHLHVVLCIDCFMLLSR